MIPPPQNLVLELPGRQGGCPQRCRHCLHRNVEPFPAPPLSHEEIVRILEQGRALGIEELNIYPHNDEISLPPYASHRYLELGARLGYRVKTVTSGAHPAGVARLLPVLHRLAVSVDALDSDTYGALRDRRAHAPLLETLRRLRTYRRDHPELMLTGLLMVNRATIDSARERVARLAELDMFTKIKLLEMLPIGGARELRHEALDHAAHLRRLAAIKREFEPLVHIGLPLWRIKVGRRGCQLGAKDLVIGPEGQLSGCTLLFYLNEHVGDIRTAGSLSRAWREIFHPLREKAARPAARICRACPFHQDDLCWGGCLARAKIFGHTAEIQRSCGFRDVEQARALYERYLKDPGLDPKLPFPLNLENL